MNSELREMYLEKADQLGIEADHLPTRTLVKEVEYASRTRQDRGSYQQENTRWAVAHSFSDPFNAHVDIPIRR